MNTMLLYFLALTQSKQPFEETFGLINKSEKKVIAERKNERKFALALNIFWVRLKYDSYRQGRG